MTTRVVISVREAEVTAMTNDADTVSEKSVDNPESRTLRAAPIGPGSLTWRHFGDNRGLLYLARAGTLQNMHPAVSGALQDHSNFFNDPLDRLFRSLPPIYGVVYDRNDHGTGTLVRNFHTELKGTDENGRRYHALAPDTFWWTHVTFFEVILDFNERFAYKKFTEKQKDQLVREAVTWWRCYGLTDRPAFDNYASFREYWEDMLDNHLINTHTTKWSTGVAEHRIAPPPKVPRWAWTIISRPTVAASNWISKALMPDKARATLEWEWTARDERLYVWFARFLTLSDRFWHLLPLRARYAPRAYAGIRNHGLETG
jgi:uncharacterized protein (DUF2236 family)